MDKRIILALLVLSLIISNTYGQQVVRLDDSSLVAFTLTGKTINCLQKRKLGLAKGLSHDMLYALDKHYGGKSWRRKNKLNVACNNIEALLSDNVDTVRLVLYRIHTTQPLPRAAATQQPGFVSVGYAPSEMPQQLALAVPGKQYILLCSIITGMYLDDEAYDRRQKIIKIVLDRIALTYPE